MNLWLLRPKFEGRDHPWEPWYDKAFGFVVRADTEEQARQLAHHKAGNENEGTVTPWLDPTYSTCEPLTDAGEPGIVLRDFRAA